MELIFFKSDTTEPTSVWTTADGIIDFRGLGRYLELEPGSIMLCNTVIPMSVDFQSDSPWTQIKDIIGVAGTIGDPVVVSGRPSVPAVPTDFVDNSEEWIKRMLLPSPTGLPQDERKLEKVLFPEQPGQLPVQARTYQKIRSRHPGVAKKFLNLADDSELPVLITSILNSDLGPVHSEMNVSAFLIYIFAELVNRCHRYSSCAFVSKLLFNLNEKTGDSVSGTTKSRSRPDTLLTASDCTFLVGEDKCSSIFAAQTDLQRKLLPLSVVSYGEVRFILGYVAAGSEFRWLYIDRNGKIRKTGPSLDLSMDSGRCQFLLSVGYAYQLISKMVDTVPDVPGRHAMFTEVVEGDRVLCFYPDSVRKSIKNFKSFCALRGTSLDVILQAYDVGEREGCNSLPRLRWATSPHAASHTESGPKLLDRAKVVGCTGTYTVEISPLGYSPMLSSEQDIRMLAKSVCEALSVLHAAGLVHRDVRYPNVVQVSTEQFMLIDLETVAASPFLVPDGFECFSEWTDEMLEGGYYTPMSDMFQLGKLLQDYAPSMTVSTAAARAFIRKLKKKVYTAAMLLNDPWLSDPIP